MNNPTRSFSRYIEFTEVKSQPFRGITFVISDVSFCFSNQEELQKTCLQIDMTPEVKITTINL